MRWDSCVVLSLCDGVKELCVGDGFRELCVCDQRSVCVMGQDVVSCEERKL